MAQPQAKMAIKEEAAKSEKPISCSHIVKKTIAFQGVDPTIPCNDTSRSPRARQLSFLEHICVAVDSMQ